ncbi:hypothetical protein QWZ03_14505 [Chitinimonas viridis]|uniref:Uncharacterized protein n=1 Tax=Chitinimonas viridis TaxID=664880 RepID=A0ABT8B8T2_9NEIS|nr:hypothetical protein [Chitinimonas viridis]MDN3577978.1 hypothetical protein [Chitinimonas viridis]
MTYLRLPCCCLLALLGYGTAHAGPADNLRAGSIAVLPLNLEPPAAYERTPAYVVSPIFRTYVEPMAQGRPLQDINSSDPNLANEQLVRSLEIRALAAASNSEVCLNRQGGDATGGGIRWSLNDGFGFYLQGKGFKQLQRLLKHNKITGICPPGDPSPMCKTLPKQVCD